MSASQKTTSPKSVDTKDALKHQTDGSESQMTRGRGRPPEPVPAQHAESIIEWISEGNTLREWCRQNKIHYSTVYLWMEKDQNFANRIARARETGHDVIAEQCFAIADEMPPMDANGKTDPGFVSWQKNRIWTRTQLLAKWNPKKYGDKVGVEHSGGLNLTVATGVPDTE